MARFTSMNDSYRSKFGFPFILAVRNATKHTILGSFAARVNHQVMMTRMSMSGGGVNRQLQNGAEDQ
jgi:2-oxo-4-hydroxy-4-carboxy--5-ureidoimidazoline (OHCU) decarboxylase